MSTSFQPGFVSFLDDNVILNQFIPYLICAKPTLIKFDFGVFTNFCIKQVKSNLVNTNTEGGKESVRINGEFVLSGLNLKTM